MDMEGKIKALERIFGNKLERDALEAVLSVCNGDVKAAEQFLTAGQNDFVDEGPSSSSALPKGYNEKPTGYELTKLKAKQLEAMRELRQNCKGKTDDGSVSEVFANEIRALRMFLFEENTTFLAHLQAYDRNPPAYAAVLALLIHQNVELPVACKGKVVAVAIARQNRPLTTYLLSKQEEFQLADILRAVKMLDAPRRYRQVDERIKKLEKGNAKAGKIRALKQRRQEIMNEPNFSLELKTSVTGATARKLRRWVGQLKKSNLEFFLLQMPDWPWKEFADVVHPSPKDFSLDYFLPCVYGAPAPEGSVVQRCRDMVKMSPEEVEKLLKELAVPYSYVRKNTEMLTHGSRVAIATYESINTVIWWYHELSCPGVDTVLKERLAKGEEPTFSYGKFMERLLYFKGMGSSFFPQLIPIAEKRLQDISLPLEPPVMVIGDASFSMDVAIRTSTIIASLLAVLSNADLRFFNSKSLTPPVVPRNAAEVLQVTEDTKADGLTAPAAALHDLYKLRQKIKYFVVVTDEIENEQYNNTFFAQLFYNYCIDVYPARIVFVSFLEEKNVKGRMVQALENLGIEPLQFRLDAAMPDLTKMDSMLGMLSADSTAFPDIVQQVISNMAPDKSLEVLAQVALASFSSLNVAKKEEKKDVADDDTKGKGKGAEQPEKEEDAGTGKDKGKGKGKAKSNVGVEEEPSADGVSLFEGKPEENDRGDMNCSICLEKRANTALVPCGHASFCMECAINIQNKSCPICRAGVQQVLKIFFS